MAKSARSVIVYGPVGCGKTHNAERFAKAYGLTYIRDGLNPDDHVETRDTLYLTNIRPPAGGRVLAVPFQEAMKKARGILGVKVIERSKDDTVEVMASAIREISQGAKALRAGALKEKALVILLSYSTGHTQHAIKVVLEGLASLEQDYLK